MTRSMSADEFRAMQSKGNPKKAKRVIAGKNAQAHGKQYEADLVYANSWYDLKRVCSVEQLPVPTQPLPPDALTSSKYAGRARLLAKPAPCDFVGVLGDIGRGLEQCRGQAVFMESKFSAKAKASMPIRTGSDLRPHQLKELALRRRNYDAISVIVARYGDDRGVLLPDAVERAFEQYEFDGKKSIPWSEFTPYEVRPAAAGHLIEHWMEPVIEWMRDRA